MTWVFQVAHHEFHLTADDPDVRRALTFVAQRAAHDLAVHRVARYDVTAVGPRDGDEIRRYRIWEDGDHLAVVDGVDAVLESLYARVAARAVELTCRLGWTRFHAGSVHLAGRRLLLLGDSGAGKTSLTLALGALGGQVQGDEIAMVRDGEALALTRRFHCKQGTGALLPAYAGAIEASPRAEHAGEEIRALDPTDVGLPWRIDIAPVDAIVLLTAERADEPRVERVASPVALPSLAGGVLRFLERPADVRRQVVRLLARPAWRVRSGPLDATADAIAQLAASL